MAASKTRAAVCGIACLFAVGALGGARAASSGGRTALRASSHERAVFQDLNERRRRSGRQPLRWDGVSYDPLQDTARVWAGGGRTESADLHAEVTRRRGQPTAWLYRLRARPTAEEAIDALLAEHELLDADYSSGSVVLTESPPGAEPHLAVAAAYVCRLVPYLPDVRGELHWAPWYVQPWAPFNTTNPFLAWQWANERVRYDHPKADHDVPGWQTPQQTQASETGVCRDTSVFLGAWLAHMGKEFRVVTGLLDDKDPHAWVVLFDGETKYLLETAIDGNMSRRYPPRLELATKYLPTEMMFDSRRVWVNRGEQRVRDYESPAVWAAATEDETP